MIVSHSRKIIYLKSYKTASTSLELALLSFCSDGDIHGDLSFYKPSIDSDKYDVSFTSTIWRHSFAEEIKKRFPDEWKSYYKISAVRNPWDMVVSSYFYSKSVRPRKFEDFSDFFYNGHFKKHGYVITNEPFLFIDGSLCVDFCIRYESIEEDWKNLLGNIGCKFTPLPQTKNKCRPKQTDYRTFYDDEMIEIVRSANVRIIEKFGYSF